MTEERKTRLVLVEEVELTEEEQEARKQMRELQYLLGFKEGDDVRNWLRLHALLADFMGRINKIEEILGMNRTCAKCGVKDHRDLLCPEGLACGLWMAPK